MIEVFIKTGQIPKLAYSDVTQDEMNELLAKLDYLKKTMIPLIKVKKEEN